MSLNGAFLHECNLCATISAAPREEKENCWGLQQVLQFRPCLCWLHPQSKRGMLLRMLELELRHRAVMLFVVNSQTCFLFSCRKARGHQHRQALHTVQDCRQMAESAAAVLWAARGPTEAPTSTPSTRLSAKPARTKAKISAPSTQTALCWTRCALKTPFTRARPARRQSAKRTRNWKGCHWVLPWWQQTAAVVRARRGRASNAAKTPSSLKPRSSRAPLLKARQTPRHSIHTQTHNPPGESWPHRGTRESSRRARCSQTSRWGRRRWAPARVRPGSPMKTSWWSQVGRRPGHSCKF